MQGMDDNVEEFAQRVRTFRGWQGISQENFAESAELHRTSLVWWKGSNATFRLLVFTRWQTDLVCK